MTHISLSACAYKETKDGPWIDGVAVIAEPGVSDVSLIIQPDGTALQDIPWDYQLWPYKGAISIPAGVTLPHDGLGDVRKD